ncbi:MAG: tetratricopeptide repeat protein [Opitutaceae bacterium]
MSEKSNEPTPLQTRRGNLIVPPSDNRDQAKPKKKRVEVQPDKAVGFLGKLFLLLVIVGAFGAFFQSDVLWSDYDTVERTAYESMNSWTEAWSMETIRRDNPLALSSYFWERSIPLPPAVAHRVINLSLHILAAFLFLKCLEGLKAPSALAVTLVFSTHPAVLHTLFWPGYRTEIIGLVFILLSLHTSIQNKGPWSYMAMLCFSATAIILHPAAIILPIIVVLVIILQNRKLHFHTFNRVLPLVCVTLFIGVWTHQHGAIDPGLGSGENSDLLTVYGQNMFFFIRQSIFPLNVSLFHSMESDEVYNIGASFSLLPFLLILPFYILVVFNFRKRWARATLLCITAYFLLSLSGVSEKGRFLDGTLAFETHGLYIALPAIIALIFCGFGSLSRHFGVSGKLLGKLVFSFFFIIQLGITASFAYSVGKPTTMWQSLSDQWPNSWIPKAALIESIRASNTETLSRDQQIEMLISILDTRPELIEERKSLARIYRDAGQDSNALREFKRILREGKPGNEFLEETALFYDKIGLSYDARNARERIQK